MRRKLEAKWYCIFAFRPTVHLYASFAALALVVQECRYHYPTDQALYTRYEMAKLKYRAFLIPHRIVNCSFSSSRIYLVRTERPVMPYEYCKCLQLLDFKRAKSLAHARIISFSLAEEQINIQSVTGQKPWKRSKDQGIHPPVHCWVYFSFELIKNANFLCALFLALLLPTRKQLSGHRWSQIFPVVVF